MPIETAPRTDLHRLADDGCPHIAGDTQTFDLPEIWSSLDEEIGDAPFALTFESGGEG